eukprot:364958-Chlamydomonas_euryale.AAC.4
MTVPVSAPQHAPTLARAHQRSHAPDSCACMQNSAYQRRLRRCGWVCPLAVRWAFLGNYVAGGHAPDFSAITGKIVPLMGPVPCEEQLSYEDYIACVQPGEGQEHNVPNYNDAPLSKDVFRAARAWLGAFHVDYNGCRPIQVDAPSYHIPPAKHGRVHGYD